MASTGQLMTELCTALQKDFDITCIAAQPGYTGEIDKSKKLYEIDFLENIKVIRVKLPKVNKSSKISRIKYIIMYFFLALYALLKEKNTDVIYTISQPPILGGLIGTIGKFLKRAKHVYNIQDFNPEQANAVNYTGSKIVSNVAISVDKMNCKFSDQVIVVGHDMVQTLQKRFKKNRIHGYSVINNWIDENTVIPLSKDTDEIAQFKEKYNLTDKFIVMYSGNIGLFYDLENIITVAKHYKENQDIVFVFIGEGAVKSSMQQYVKEHDLCNVLFLPYQPKEYIKYSLNAADIHLVVNQKGIKGVSVPSKIYGVMAAGKPIVGVLELGSEAERLITDSQCGIIVEPQNYEGIIESIKYFYQMNKKELDSIGYNGRVYLEKNLKKETSIRKYRDLLQSI